MLLCRRLIRQAWPKSSILRTRVVGRLMIVSEYRCFLVGFNALSLPVQDLTGFFETCAGIANWYGILPGQVFIVSSLDARTLNRLIGSMFPKEFFIVAQLDSSATD